MVPSAAQHPPLPSAASQIVVVGPPLASTRLSFPAAKNAICRPSGDQNGYADPSVPGSSTASASPSDRTYNVAPPCELTPNTTRRPSGEMAGGDGFCPRSESAASGGST